MAVRQFVKGYATASVVGLAVIMSSVMAYEANKRKEDVGAAAAMGAATGAVMGLMVPFRYVSALITFKTIAKL
jgi:hypothetical protein